jgi:pimeloyl-ACP methyl ester carboxylesterase
MDQLVVEGGRTRVHGVEIELAREGKGKPMLILHGGSGPTPQAPYVKALAKSFDVLVPGHPGFGTSPLPAHFDHIDDLAYFYLDLMDALDLREVRLMGFSLGGWLAMEIAVKSTARIAKLILVDSVGIKVGGPTDRDIVDIFATAPDQLAKLMFHDPSKAPDPAKFTDEQALIAGRNREAMAVYGWEPYLHDPKLKGRLHRIDVPTLVVWGASDRLVTPSYGRALAGFIPGARFVAIEAAGHGPNMEQPQKFVELVGGFAA